jgi:hypothetical protein
MELNMKPESNITQQTQLDEFQLPGAEMNNTSQMPTQGTLPNGEIDHEGAMAKADLFKLGQYSYKLFKKLEDDTQLESWVQAKITKAADYIASVYHYLEYEMKFNEYGHQLDNSDVLSESEKQVIRGKLNEARAKIKDLKIAQAQKLAEGKPTGLHPNTLKSYTKAASQDLVDKSTKLAKTDSSKKQDELGRKVVNRTRGIANAVDRMEEAAPSAGLTKAKKSLEVEKAVAGKDIGKPGKNFKKVSAKAAKKYGSKKAGDNVAAAAMWRNIKEGVEHAFGEGVYSSDETQIEDVSTDIAALNKPEKFAPVTPQNIKGARPTGNVIPPDPDEYSAGANIQGKPVEQSIADLQKSHPKLYAAFKQNPQLVNKVKANPSLMLDLLTNPKYQPTFEDVQLDELDLKPWEKKSPFSKKGYEGVSTRQKTKMKDAEDATEIADENGDNSGIKKAGQDWKKAKETKEKAERKANLAKKESINESADLAAIKMLSGLK